jgi:transposase
MQNILSKDTIEKEILPHLPTARHGYVSRVELWRVVQAILYKLITGCQWRMLPTREFFPDSIYSWKSVYHHFRKWCRSQSLHKLWLKVLERHRRRIDLSCSNLDGTHTPVKRGGLAVGYQRRKRSKTTNMLFLSDSRGMMIACSQPIEGQHHDVFDIGEHFHYICSTLQQASIPIDGLFVNADTGFDCQNFRKLCQSYNIQLNCKENKRNQSLDNMTTEINQTVFDPLLYENRFVIERSNAWLDAFKNLLVRFDTNPLHWLQWHYLAFTLRFLLTFKEV